jgi:hypothetical protein
MNQSVRKWQHTGYFFTNVAIADMVTSLSWLSLSIAPMIWSFDWVNQLVALILIPIIYGTFLSSIIVQLPNTLSRYILFCSASGRYEKLFSKKTIILYFICVDIYPYFLLFGGLLINFDVFAVIFIVSFVICFIIILFCSYRLYFVVKRQ